LSSVIGHHTASSNLPPLVRYYGTGREDEEIVDCLDTI